MSFLALAHAAKAAQDFEDALTRVEATLAAPGPDDAEVADMLRGAPDMETASALLALAHWARQEVSLPFRGEQRS